MADRTPKAVLLFGAPGVGKGTQGRILGAIPGYLHLAMGEVFRGLDKASDLGKIVRGFATRGELVPDDITIRLWREHVGHLIDAGRYSAETDLLLLDGIPRNPNQARLLDSELRVIRVLHLTAAENAMVERLRRRALKENRADDAREEVIRRRWEIYRAETAPVLAHYPASTIAEVNALGTPIEVLRRLLEVAPDPAAI
jgi:adenylate kinase